MISETLTLAQLLADFTSITAQVKALQSKADNFLFLFNATKIEASRVSYQDQAVIYINESLLLQARLMELQTLILSYNFFENETESNTNSKKD